MSEITPAPGWTVRNVKPQSVISALDRESGVPEFLEGRLRALKRQGDWRRFLSRFWRKGMTKGLPELVGVGCGSVQIVHALVVLHMGGSLDFLGIQVPVDSLGHGGGMAKKDPLVDMVSNLERRFPGGLT